MPLYEYQCKKCKHKFEKIQKFSDSPIRKCPECGGAVEKVMHAPNVQFKGTGWYVTDYGGKGDKSERSKPEGRLRIKPVRKKESTGKEDEAKSKDKDGGSKKPEPKKSKRRNRRTEKVSALWQNLLKQKAATSAFFNAFLRPSFYSLSSRALPASALLPRARSPVNTICRRHVRIYHHVIAVQHFAFQDLQC